MKNKYFIPPKLEEVAAYCRERKNQVAPEVFIEYYSARGWFMKAGVKMKDWRAAVRYWEIRHRQYNGHVPLPNSTGPILTEAEQKVLTAYIDAKGFKFSNNKARAYFDEKNLANARNLLKLTGSDVDMAIKAIKDLAFYFYGQKHHEWHFGWVLNNFTDWYSDMEKKKREREVELARQNIVVRKLDALIFKAVKTFKDAEKNEHV
jgi:hypothetical protein